MERDDPSVDVVTLETPNLSSMIAANSASLTGSALISMSFGVLSAQV